MTLRKSNVAAPAKGLTQVEAADRLRQSTSWIRTLTTRGVLTRLDDGTYPWPQVAEEYDRYRESLEDQQPAKSSDDLEAARTRKYLVEALLREDELAARRGDLIPADDVEQLVRAPLEAVDGLLSTAPRRHSQVWAAKMGISRAEAMALIHELVEDLRAELRKVFEDDDNARA